MVFIALLRIANYAGRNFDDISLVMFGDLKWSEFIQKLIAY